MIRPVVHRSLTAERLVHDTTRLLAAVAALEGDLEAVDEGAIPSVLSEFPHALRDVRVLADRLLAALDGATDRDAIRGRKPLRPRVLVVDDVRDARELLAMILRSEDFDVVTASNGLEALIIAHAVRPSVILMDVAMPVLDGIEATRLLKATAATQHVPVIAHTNVPAACGGHDELFAQILPKPVIPSALVALVRRFVPAASSPVPE